MINYTSFRFSARSVHLNVGADATVTLDLRDLIDAAVFTEAAALGKLRIISKPK